MYSITKTGILGSKQDSPVREEQDTAIHTKAQLESYSQLLTSAKGDTEQRHYDGKRNKTFNHPFQAE